jgi:hypothetical protein
VVEPHGSNGCNGRNEPHGDLGNRPREPVIINRRHGRSHGNTLTETEDEANPLLPLGWGTRSTTRGATDRSLARRQRSIGTQCAEMRKNAVSLEIHRAGCRSAVSPEPRPGGDRNDAGYSFRTRVDSNRNHTRRSASSIQFSSKLALRHRHARRKPRAPRAGNRRIGASPT